VTWNWNRGGWGCYPELHLQGKIPPGWIRVPADVCVSGDEPLLLQENIVFMTTASKIQTRSKASIDLDEIIEGMESLDTTTLESFMQRVGTLVARKKTPKNRPAGEASLLSSIYNAIPAGLQKRFEVLSSRSREGLLTAEERAEFLQTIDQLEQKHAERLEKLIELAQMRGVPLNTLMQELQLSSHG